MWIHFSLGLLVGLLQQDPGAYGSSLERWSTKRLIEVHQERRPRLEVQDVYKLLYQGCFGVEHMLSDSAAAGRYLLEELKSLDMTVSDEPLLERISTTGNLVRLNLRPFKELNLDPELVVQLMLGSAEQTQQDTLRFRREWNEFCALVRFGLLRFPAGEVDLWNARIDAGVIVPVHHSDQYNLEYKPAYRVVRLALAQSLLQPGGRRE